MIPYVLTCMQPGGDPHVLCFVDFDNPAQATIALEALQGDNTYICGYGACIRVDYLTNFCDMQFPTRVLVKFHYSCLHLLLVCRVAFLHRSNFVQIVN